MLEIKVGLGKQPLYRRLHADPDCPLRHGIRLAVNHGRLLPTDLPDVVRERLRCIPGARRRVPENDDRCGWHIPGDEDNVSGAQRGQRRQQQDGHERAGVVHG